MQNIETYRKINKQLVDQNREMRRELAAYREMQSQLCNQLIDERTHRVSERMRFVNTVLRHFRATLNEVDPDLDLLNLLSAHEEIERDHSDGRTGTDRASKGEQKGSTESRRRTIREASQRVSMIARNSLVLVSPTRRKRSSKPSDDPMTPPTVVTRRCIPFENASEAPPANENEAEHSEYIESVESSVEQTQSAAEEEEMETTEVAGEEQVVEQVEHAEANGAALQLDDINEDTEKEDTGMLTIESYRKETSNTNRSRCRRGQGTTVIPLQDLTNHTTSLATQSSIEESSLERTRSPHIVCRRGKTPKLDILADIVLPRIIINAAPSGQVAAPQAAASASTASMQQPPTMLRVAVLAAGDASVSSFTIDDLSSGNIADAPSSTPCHQKRATVVEQTAAQMSPTQHSRRTRSQDSMQASARSKRTRTMRTTPTPTTTTVTSTTNDGSTLVSDSNATSERPRRKCAPTNMAEERINKKMRNEGRSERRNRRHK